MADVILLHEHRLAHPTQALHAFRVMFQEWKDAKDSPKRREVLRARNRRFYNQCVERFGFEVEEALSAIMQAPLRPVRPKAVLRELREMEQLQERGALVVEEATLARWRALRESYSAELPGEQAD